MFDNVFMPPANSTTASEVDALFYFILTGAVYLFFLLTFVSLYFVWRFRRTGRQHLTSGIAHNTTIETIWTVIPTVLVFIIFIWGFRSYMNITVVPKDALEIKVTAQKWFWNFEHPDGTSSNELVVPAGRAVQMVMHSRDVIHGFYVPDFRVKQDVLPNRYTVAWFQTLDVGEHNLFCSSYCGDKHSGMITKVKVVSQYNYDRWLEANNKPGAGMSMAAFGEKIYNSRGCASCHSVDGSANNGPTWKGLYGSMQPLSDGTKIKADENYIRESILEPNAKIVQGFQPIMPTYQGLLKDVQIDALIAYMKTLK
jgi:cytochrome c oxidase subunit 2